MLFVRHFANPRKVELGKIGCDGSVKVRFDSENTGENFVEFTLIRVSLVNNVEQRSGRVGRQAHGCVPACSATVDDVKRVHLQAAGPEDTILQRRIRIAQVHT